MNAEPIDAVSNPHGPTGPRTEPGKARSSRNATKHGLFAAHHAIHEDEAEEYAQTLAALMQELSPEGVLEETFAAEIMSAAWRLRRCLTVAADLAGRANPEPEPLDPMPDDIAANEQKSVDRARAQSHNILRRSIAELRKLQTERTIRTQLHDPEMPRLADIKQVFNTLNIHDKQCLTARKADGLDTLEGLMAKADREIGMQVMDKANSAAAMKTDRSGVIPTESVAQTQDPSLAATKTDRSGLIPTISVAQTQDAWSESSFCKPAQTAPNTAKMMPRNAACPCKSGAKYKRCCGKNAPAVLNTAA